jgi:hypothetical protein
MAGYKEMDFKRNILGVPVQITETKDGVQRCQFIRDDKGREIGRITTDKWSQRVTATAADGETMAEIVGTRHATKDSAFVGLRRWLIAYAFNLSEPSV